MQQQQYGFPQQQYVYVQPQAGYVQTALASQQLQPQDFYSTGYQPVQQQQYVAVQQQQFVQASAPPIEQKKETKEERFKRIAMQYEISDAYAKEMKKLEGYEIVYIVDDSGSMNNPAHPDAGPYEPKVSRWDELKKTVMITCEIATTMDPTGVDVYFLNREPIRNIGDVRELETAFAVQPQGGTPLCKTLRRVLNEKKDVVKERKLLIMIATDGEPTDDYGRSDIATLRKIIKNERNPIDRIYVTFLACTDDKSAIEHLNEFDNNIKNVDTVDDYKSELAEVRKAKNSNSYRFSMGDYVVKSLVGAISKKFDNADESHCCVIL